MIFLDDSEIRVGGVTLPGLVKSLEVDDGALVEEQDVELLRAVLNNMFVSHAEGLWLRLKAADYGKWQKPALKTQGYVTISRGGGDDAVKILKADTGTSGIQPNVAERPYAKMAGLHLDAV